MSKIILLFIILDTVYFTVSLFNLIAGFILYQLLFVIILLLPYYTQFLHGDGYKVYDAYYESFHEFFVKYIWHTAAYPYFASKYFISVLIPFQIIKDVYYKKYNKEIHLMYKILILILMSFLRNLFFNFLPLILGAVIYGLVIGIFMYVFVDRYVEIKNNLEEVE